MNSLKALIFDVDGTLADTERQGHRVAFNQTFAAAGLDWNWSEELYGELLNISGGKERIHDYLNRYQPEFKVKENLEQFVAQLHQEKTERYQQLLANSSIPLRPGVKRLIQEARSHGLKLAIATTSALPTVLALLEKNLDASWFEVIAAGDIVSRKKPAPDIYFYVLEYLNLTAQNGLVFEDSHQGLTAATQAGLKTIVTVNRYTQDQDFAHATLVLNHLGEPDQPCRVLAGPLQAVNYLTVDHLYQLLP
ncbi:MAG: HAD family hydrolase [Microcoleaceae cyanobacterium]